jgi:hypothetical protein
MMWRVGRESLRSDDPPPGQIVASMRTSDVINGMIGEIPVPPHTHTQTRARAKRCVMSYQLTSAAYKGLSTRAWLVFTCTPLPPLPQPTHSPTHPPTHSLTERPIDSLGIVDQSMAGVHVYTADGLFVDTLFVSGSYEQKTLYGLPGEFFAGDFHTDSSGNVFARLGKVFILFIFFIFFIF